MTQEEFRDWRISRGLNQAEAGQVLRVARLQVWRWEHGHAPLPAVTVLLCWILRNTQVFEAVKKHISFVPQRRGRKKPVMETLQ